MLTLIIGFLGLVGLVLLFLTPIVFLVAMIKPTWFGKLGESRKQIGLKLAGVWLVGLVIILATPFEEASKDNKTTVQQNTINEEQPKAEQPKPAEKKKTDSSKPGIMTLDKFNRIETGMTAEQVQGIVGGLGTVASESEMAGYKTVILQFEGSGTIGANANITFQNGKVVMKAQAGLK